MLITIILILIGIKLEMGMLYYFVLGMKIGVEILKVCYKYAEQRKRKKELEQIDNEFSEMITELEERIKEYREESADEKTPEEETPEEETNDDPSKE